MPYKIQFNTLITKVTLMISYDFTCLEMQLMVVIQNDSYIDSRAVNILDMKSSHFLMHCLSCYALYISAFNLNSQISDVNQSVNLLIFYKKGSKSCFTITFSSQFWSPWQ